MDFFYSSVNHRPSPTPSGPILTPGIKIWTNLNIPYLNNLPKKSHIIFLTNWFFRRGFNFFAYYVSNKNVDPSSPAIVARFWTDIQTDKQSVMRKSHLSCQLMLFEWQKLSLSVYLFNYLTSRLLLISF